METLGYIGLIIATAYIAGLIPFTWLFILDDGPKDRFAFLLILIWPLAVLYTYCIKEEEHL